jgi:hypothetical protein
MCDGGAVTVEAPLYYGGLDPHRIRTRLGVTGGATEHRIGAARVGKLLGVTDVSEPEVARTRCIRWRPLHPLLDVAVVANRAIGIAWPQRASGILCSGVAAEAGWKQGAVLPMIEPTLDYARHKPAGAPNRDDRESQEAQYSRLHREAAR